MYTNINTLRFLGALFVLFGHTFVLCYGPGGGEDPISEWLKGVTGYHAKLPGIGVAIFFVLSGYLVTRSFESRDNLALFIEARVLRIFPALWVTLTITALVLGPLVSTMEPSEYLSHPATWKYVVYNAKLFPDVMYRLPGVFLDNPRMGGVNGSLWTLPVELRMYAFVAIMGIMGLLHRIVLFNIVALLIVVWFVMAPEYFVLLHKLNHERLGVYFLLGAFFYLNRDQITYHWTGLAALSILLIINFKGAFYNLIYAVWFSYLVLYISFHRSIQLPDLGKYGDFSYGLYLWAYPVTQLSILLLGSNSPWPILLITFFTTMVLAIASWFLVEKPAMRLKGRLVAMGPWLKSS